MPYKKQLIYIGLGIMLGALQSCSILEHNRHHHSQYNDVSNYKSFYNHDYQDDARNGLSSTHQGTNTIDDEKPVQMTTKDSHLKTVSPVSTTTSKPSSNVLLPINANNIQ